MISWVSTLGGPVLPVIEITRRPLRIGPPFEIWHRKKNGSLFLAEEKAHFWDIHGFMIRTRNHKISCIFRRYNIDRALRAINHR
jgi:hypothetical protein